MNKEEFEKNFCQITSTFDNEEEVNKVRDVLLEKKLIACAEITRIDSKYIWKGKIEHSSEFLLRVLTKKSNFENIKNLIEEMHSYDTCGVLMYDIIDGNEKFLEWIEEVIE